MKKYITQTLMSIAFVASVVAAPILAPSLAAAATPKEEACSGVTQVGGSGCTGGDFNKFINNVINILIFIIGAISVIMIVVGGLRYTLSGGDSNSVSAGKDTILYAIVGLVVAIMAYSIVNFVIFKL